MAEMNESDWQVDRKKSSSLLPELETMEIPASLKLRLERMEGSSEEDSPVRER